MEKQKEYSYNPKPFNPRSRQSPNTSSKPQNDTIEGTEDITLSDSTNEEIERQKQHIETSLVILHNLHIERANMEFWSWFEMVTKGMK